MPTLLDIVSREKEEGQAIHLYSEGLFYKAYDRSAWLCCMLFQEFKVSCRFVKTVGDHVLSIGFPQSSLGKWTSGREVSTSVGGGRYVLKYQ